jgi:magnesium transporter
MIVPRVHDAATSITASSLVAFTVLLGDGGRDEDGSGKKGPGNWSSLIGIITAIVGNILISFALNTQRYAHTRLEQEWQEKERRRKDTLRRAGYEGQGYGTQQADAPNGRAKRSAPSPSRTNGVGYSRLSRDSDNGEDARDTDPLIASNPGDDLLSNSTSTLQELADSEFKQESYLRSPYWWVGIILMTTGEAGNFLAYGFAPASIVSPLGVVALVSNCIIAPLMFKEPFRKRDFLGVFVAVTGAVTVVLSASDSNPKLGPDVIWGMITTWEFETYLGITILCIIGLMLASKKYGQKSILIDLGLVGLFGKHKSPLCPFLLTNA